MSTDSTDEVFTAGVASFDPTEDSVLLWTLLDGVDTCSWELALDQDFTELVASGSAEQVGDSPTVVVEATGLSAGRTHWYRFTAAGHTSPIGRTRTLPSGSPDRLRLGVTCCARFGQACFDVYRELAAADVDLVIHLGDYIYEDTKYDIEGREPRPDHDCVTLEDYRTRHRQFRTDVDLQQLHQRHPMVVILDDHDLADNAHRQGASNHDPDTQGPWAPRRAAALRAHQEFLPKRLADADDPGTGWRHLDAGSLARVVCTETRAQRDPQAGLPDAAPADDPERTMLGADQRAWLDEVVADPTPRWTVVLSGTVVSELTLDAPDSLDGALPEKYAVEDGRALNSDQWDGYQADRDVLVAAARRRGGSTLVLSGDIHSAWAIEGPADQAGPVAVELTCPPAATTPLGQLLPPGGGELLARTVTEQLAHVRWMSGEHRGFIVIDLTAERAQASYWWVDSGDDASDPPQVLLGRRLEVPAGGLPARLIDLEPDRPTTTPPPAPDRRRPVVLVLATVGAAAAVAGAVVALRRRSAR
jgi:alkaline phosphatase D